MIKTCERLRLSYILRCLFVEAAATIGCNYNATHSNVDLTSLSASNNESCSCLVTANSTLSLYLDIMVNDVQVDGAAVFWPVVKVMGTYMCARSNVSHSTMVHMTNNETLRLRLYGAQHAKVKVAVTFQGISFPSNTGKLLSKGLFPGMQPQMAISGQSTTFADLLTDVFVHNYLYLFRCEHNLS